MCGIPDTLDGPAGPEHADFRALRHSFVARLNTAGLTLEHMRLPARHSDPKLTARTYGRTRPADPSAAVARAGALLAPDAPPAAASQGVAARPACAVVAPAPRGGLPAPMMTSGSEACGPRPAPERKAFAGSDLVTTSGQTWEGERLPPDGFEPSAYGLGNRRSIP